MLDKLLKITGTVALYGCASMFLASLLLGTYLTYAWQIDQSKRIRMIAIAQGHDLADIQKAVENRIAEMSYDQVLELRAKRLRALEFEGNTSERNVTGLLLADEKKIDEKLRQIDERRKAFDQHVQNSLDRTKSKGLAEQTRLIEEAEPETAKNIILGIIKDFGDYERVLTMLLSMDDKRRGQILYAMESEEELKTLVTLLQKIGNGEPLAKVIEEAKKLSEEKSEQSEPRP